MGIVIRDTSGEIFDNSSLPEMLNFTDFDWTNVVIAANTGSAKYEIFGNLTSLRVRVPEPTTLSLILAALIFTRIFRLGSRELGSE
jgi:hypothetical protein